MKRLIFILTAFLGLAILAAAQIPDPVSWRVTSSKIKANQYEIKAVGIIEPGWHIYGLDEQPNPTVITLEGDGIQLIGEPKMQEPATLTQGVLARRPSTVNVHIQWQACKEGMCLAPDEFQTTIQIGTSAAPAKSGSLWGLILEAIIWGFLMLLTPCVFPMVPMTVSFFLKQSGSPAAGRFKAAMYGLFIVLLYTVPICVIIGLTWALGGAGVTADIFNWLATHWLPNILFFVIFMVFAASFFGAFEIVLPEKWTTGADAKSSKKGLLGVFFLALTLVLVSFSCTGPIVGTVLIKSTQGEFWMPMVTMLAFSIAFALPFSLLAFFPSVLKKLPRSGGWLNSVKVVLGFIELALGLKFLSVADQTYHWHLLDREVYLAIWIVVFTLLGLYLMGKIRFKQDSPLEYISVGRLALIIADFAFVVYMIPGMWGAPLKALSGYLPPIQTQDFVIQRVNAGGEGPSALTLYDSQVSLPHGLTGYTSLEDGIAAADASGKNVFVDITGHGCVNCREMEARVWSDPEVLKRLANDFVIVSLYVDDKTKLPEDKWVTTPEGKVLKDVGRVNSRVVLERFGVNSQPNYFILDSRGNILSGPRGYNLDTEAFVKFLDIE